MTKKTNPDQRDFHFEIDLNQSPERVWKALTDAEEAVRWFPQAAEVEPGPGGKIRWSWDIEGCAFDTRIDVWEPGKRLRLLEQKIHEGESVELAMDFQLTGRHGGTSLRLVHSGFGRGADWDDEFNGISRGWAYELGQLRYYLDHFDGLNRALAMFAEPTSLDERTAFERLLSEDGFGGRGGVFAKPVGEEYVLGDGLGGEFRGRVILHNAPFEFAGTVEGNQPGVLRFHVEMGAVFLSLAIWGDETSRAEAFQQHWQAKLPQLVK